MEPYDHRTGEWTKDPMLVVSFGWNNNYIIRKADFPTLLNALALATPVNVFADKRFRDVGYYPDENYPEIKIKPLGNRLLFSKKPDSWPETEPSPLPIEEKNNGQVSNQDKAEEL